MSVFDNQNHIWKKISQLLKGQLETCKRAHRQYIGTLLEIPSTEINLATGLQEKVCYINSETHKEEGR